MFSEVQAIAIPADCPYELLTDIEATRRIPATELAALLAAWEERNQIDGDAAIDASDTLVAATVRWRLRGMDMDMAIRKTRTDECYRRELRKTQAATERLMAHPLDIQKPILANARSQEPTT